MQEFWGKEGWEKHKKLGKIFLYFGYIPHFFPIKPKIL